MHFFRFKPHKLESTIKKIIVQNDTIWFRTKVLYYDFIATNNLVYRRNEGPKFSFRDIAESNNALYFTTEGVLQYLSSQLEGHSIPRQHRDHEKGKKITMHAKHVCNSWNYDLCPRKDAILALFLVKLSKLWPSL